MSVWRSAASGLSHKLRSSLVTSCQKLEQRPIRQELLLKTYLNNVAFSEDESRINLSKLHEQYSYVASPRNVLLSMYNYGVSKTTPEERNPFRLPVERTFIKERFQRSEGQCERMTMEYLKLVVDMQPSRIPMKQRWMGILLKRNSDYDVVKLEFQHRDKEGNKVDTESTLHLIEHKPLNRGLDMFQIEEILKDSGGYIESLQGIQVKNNFSGSHVYEIKSYDESYGFGSFNEAILSSLYIHYDPSGEASIRNESTLTMIKGLSTEKITSDFINNSKHTNGDTRVEIGPVLDLYQIDGYELLYAMYRGTNPLGMGFLDHYLNKTEADSFTIKSAQEMVDSQDYFDYLYGKSIKNGFRKKRGDPQAINIRSYDYDYSKFYRCLFSLMSTKQV